METILSRILFAAIILCLLNIESALSQNVLKLEANESPGKGTLSELSWLTGYWKGTGLGGDCDEVWLPKEDNSMAGIFRYSREGVIVFSEYMVIEQIGETLSLKLKHFSRDLSPWEEKDEWIEFRLIKIEDDAAWFDGLTYRRTDHQLLIWIAISTGEEERIEEFRLTKSEL
jgi:hypothetical protein